jgi:hypothetical protein
MFQFLEVSLLDEEELNCVPPNKFEAEGYSCSVINNNFLILLQLVLLFSARGIVTFLKDKMVPRVRLNPNFEGDMSVQDIHPLDKSKNESQANMMESFDKPLSTKNSPKPSANFKRTKKPLTTSQKIIMKLDNYFNHSFFIYMLNSMLMDLFLTSLMNVWFLDFKSSGKVFSNILSIFFIILYTCMIYKLCKIMISFEQAKKDKIMSTHLKTKFKKWLFLRVAIKDDKPTYVRLIPEYLLVHEYFLCVFIVIFNYSGLT